ncbi:energy transducer TonB [Sphingomonas sp. ERG5]|uniref:energy transducer TonB n=1 Tax=Sphingomonas sp. ERG5 TaxID=1381597 RepID=UPI00068FD7CA|nr:energy transducer TonB [Sphingomonas sp. ERG5]
MFALIFIMSLAQSAPPADDKVIPLKPRTDPGDWFPLASYPKEARKEHAEGRVSIQLDVDATGKPTACRVTASSGFVSLDEHTCRIAMKTGRYTPKRVNGVAVPTQTFIRNVIWNLR